MTLRGGYLPGRLWAVQLAEELARRLHKAVNLWPAADREHPGDQLIRSADSVGINLIEGYARVSQRDRFRFYDYAISSSEEVLGWIHKCRDRGLIPPHEAGVHCGMYIRLGKAIENLVASEAI
jgi:four helix bundle protein